MCGDLVWKVCGSTFEPAAVVGLDAEGVEVQRVGRAGAAGGVEHHLGAHPAAAVQDGDRRSRVVELDALDLGSRGAAPCRGRASGG